MYPAPLIATKLRAPSVGADLISRTQLFQSLEQGLQVPLILISAPPGFGKSMLMASWIHTHTTDLQTAWLSLDESDNEPGLFWRYFIAALQSVHHEIGEMIQTMLAAPAPPEMRTSLTQLLNELSTLESPLLLVLDDYHLVQSQSIHEDLKFFIDHLPANIHIALLTREDPPLGLARRRARRQMIEIRASDLRFNSRETTDFLNGTHKLYLSQEQIRLLEERTEGWVTALQLAALSIQGRDPSQFFETFAGDDRYIADYLIEEVLQRQPESVRAFLLKTSILEHLSPALCAAVTGEANAREYLYRLEQGNLFLIPLDNHREWYRYHHLFAELLRLRLPESYPVEEIARLHQIASAWYESQREIPAAIRHAHQIPDEPRVWQLLEQYVGPFYQHGTLPQLFELANTVSAVQRETSPVLCAAVAWAALASNHFEAVEDWLKAIERHFSRSADSAITDPTLDPISRAALLEVLVIRQQLPTSPQTAERILAIRDQLNSLAPNQPCLFNVVASLKPVINFNLGVLAENSGETVLAVDAFTETVTSAREKENWHLYHLARGHLAGLQMTLGHLHIARQTCEQGLAENTSMRASPYLSLLHACLGLLHYEWNDLPTAERHFNEGLALARLWNHWESRVPIILGLARLQQRTGDFEGALHLLKELDSLPLENLVPLIEAHAALLRCLSGDQTGSAAWLTAKMDSSSLEPAPTNESGLLDVARLMLLLQRTTDVHPLLEKICAAAQSSGRMYIFIRAKVILSKVFAIQGQIGQALACLMETIPLAAAEGYSSTFIDEGETMRQLLHEMKSKIASAELRSYVDQLLAAFGSGKNLPVKQEAGYGAPELSEREQEILAFVAAGLSNQEIAERLIISITTVKTHVGNIFKKLGVTSRTQAIARAEGLGLLPPR